MSDERLVSVVVEEAESMALAGRGQGRLWPELKLPQYPLPELMTVHEAAAKFHVNEAFLEQLVTSGQIIEPLPILGHDDWGNAWYSTTAIQEAIKRL